MKKVLQATVQAKNFRRIFLPIILLVVLALIGYFSFKSPAKKVRNISVAEASAKVETFVNQFLMQPGSKATIKEVTEEYGLYKLKIDIVTDVVDSYVSRDGKLFFPQALDIDKISNPVATEPETGGQAAPAAVVSQKNSKPVVELFVMSYCPYGTQMEKGLLPVLAALGNKIDFTLKFNDYAMHGEKELTENLLQYCIQEEQPEKLAAYLQCFLADSQSATCLETADINKSKVTSCVAKTDKQYKVSENFANKVGWQGSYPGFDVYKEDNAKYGVGGSPTLIINGEQIQSGRDSASLLATICSAFDNPPSACETELSSAAPSAGFGFNAAASNTGAAQCN